MDNLEGYTTGEFMKYLFLKHAYPTYTIYKDVTAQYIYCIITDK